MTVSKAHRFCHCPLGFLMSSYLQDLVAFTGQNHVYEDASEQLKKSNGLEISAKQIERVTNAYGQIAEASCSELQETLLKEKYDESLQAPLYCMMDGSMVLTREDDWKEVKLARIFSEQDRLQLSKSRNELRDSEYVGHIGGINGFFKKMDGMANRLDKAVFIADGAKWIWSWVDDHYPDSTQILDFFHCKEKLCDFAKIAISSEKQDNWIAEQSNCLLEDGIDQVIETINNTKTTAGKATQTKRSLLNYYEVNQKRMKYKTFRDKGLLIGSGAMESAHRTVVQSRLKRSGQRWSIRGAQNVLNLRTINKSGHWNLIKNISLN